MVYIRSQYGLVRPRWEGDLGDILEAPRMDGNGERFGVGWLGRRLGVAGELRGEEMG